MEISAALSNAAEKKIKIRVRSSNRGGKKKWDAKSSFQTEENGTQNFSSQRAGPSKPALDRLAGEQLPEAIFTARVPLRGCAFLGTQVRSGRGAGRGTNPPD